MNIDALKNMLPLGFRAKIADFRGRGVYSGYPDQYKCVFIHIPKTAGTSVTQALFGPVSRHVPYFEYERANPRKFREYFKFAFVRNPWDRLLSAYVFLKKGGLNQMDRAWAEAHLSQFETFEEFVTEWVNETNIWSWIHFIPQHYFICDSQDNIKMDFVGRMEKIQEDFFCVCRKINKKGTIHVVNKTRSNHYSDYYNNITREIVSNVYAKDIELFSYKFGK